MPHDRSPPTLASFQLPFKALPEFGLGPGRHPGGGPGGAGGAAPTDMLKLVDELLDSVWLVPELEELGLGFIKAGEGVAICVASLASASAAFVASSS